MMKKNSYAKCAEIAEYIDENLNEDITLEKLAEVFEISKYYLCRIFKSHIKMSVVQYINIRRIEKTIYYYNKYGMSFLEASQCAGFRNYSAFYKTYRNQFGVCPSQKMSDV